MSLLLFNNKKELILRAKCLQYNKSIYFLLDFPITYSFNKIKRQRGGGDDLKDYCFSKRNLIFHFH